MNKQNFIKTSDADTKSKLISLGFKLISEDGNMATFLNQSNLTFDDKKMKVIYSNKLTF